ncbi:unnamed protein product [Phytophthora fragariaefolia]|uniref:Unnamed protein product n=1 Tax=Phytophthora fragariaefolia TaxID=1490495 RepID=A0A9W6Y106_9STRA|nr:unnamed protein product [Phytophthora fragariaefolia]
MADSAQLMHSMLAAMETQTQLIDELRKSRQLSELKLNGQYFLAKGIDWKDSKLSERILAVLAGSLRYGAAQWYIIKKGDVKSVQDFFEKLEEAFVPPDLQERLRGQMNDLKERQCRDLPDYTSKFRHLITQVKEMSELDKIMYFLRSLPSSIREEVQYRRSATLTDAITVALDYDRFHAHRGRSKGARDRPRYRSYDNRRPFKIARVRNMVDMDAVHSLFHAIAKRAMELKLSADRGFNMDETSFIPKGTSCKVLTLKGSTNVWSKETSST